ncbi:APC membrane recruitment protein 2 [Osmerus mordax]|uniref:APC membrane recruitment protein 2 n=1 Tax=Osmerus mordax TaxID=8014 RepID=UPI00350F13AD
MEVQSECVEPVASPAEPQPSGKINKAAFKLFGKRRSGSGMAGFFSFRNKGANGNSVNGNTAADLVRSKTHDGLTSERGEEPGSQEAGPVRSLSKSLSFFSLLRRGSGRTNDSGGFSRRGRGLKGFFSSIRWRRKDRALEGGVEVAEGREAREGDIIVPEEVKDVTLTLEPLPHPPQEDHGSSEAEPNSPETETAASVTATPTHHVSMAVAASDSPYTPEPSPLRDPLHPKPSSPPLDPPSEPSVDRLCSLLFTDVTSLKSFDSLTGCGDIIADAEEEGGGNGGSASSSSSGGGSGGGAGGGAGRGGRGGGGGRAGVTSMVRGSPVKAPLSHHPSLPAGPSPAPLPSRARPPAQQPSGSSVVAYMGAGEEMASPDGVDDADMQGLWHMLPSTGDNSPALPRPHPTPGSTHPPRPTTSNPPNLHPAPTRSVERRPPQVKALGLSRIPVVGAKPSLPHARLPGSPNEKEALSDEGYWDTPTATPSATPDDGGLLRNQRIALTRDSCSGDQLYDLYNDPEEEAERSGEEEDLTSTPSPSAGDPLSQTSPPSSSSSSSFRSMKGSVSLPRESKIPVSLKQNTPPHSTSQSALSSVLEASPPPPKTQAPPPARTRIPVSKVPVRRSGNQPGNATRGTAHRK